MKNTLPTAEQITLDWKNNTRWSGIQRNYSAEDVVRQCENKLGVKLGESTPDGRVYLKREEECLAACCGAPMMVVNGHYHEHLTAEKVDEILDGLK